MSDKNLTRKLTKDEMIAIKECAAKLGHAPSQTELKKEIDVGPKTFQREFGSYTKALRACGLEREGSGYQIGMEKLFAEWARIVREMGETPSVAEYELRIKYSLNPLRRRFGSWRYVPAGLAAICARKRVGAAMG